MTLVLFIIMLGIFAGGLSIGRIPYENLNDAVTAEVIRSDGSHSVYSDMAMPNLNQGDEILFTVPIPEEARGQWDALCFYQYHSEITASVNGQMIYQFGQEQTRAGEMHGNELIAMVLPEEAYGQNVMIRVLQTEGRSSSHFTNFRLMHMEENRLYALIGNTIQFLLFSMMLMISILVLAIYLIALITTKGRVPDYIVHLAFFSFLVSIWELSSRRLFYLLISNRNICAVSEYHSLYLFSIPFLLYLISTRKVRWMRRTYRVFCYLAILENAWIIIARLFLGRMLVDFEQLNYAMIFLFMAAAIIIELLQAHRDPFVFSDSLHWGIIGTLILALLQIFLLILKNHLVSEFWIRVLQRMDLASVAILFFMFSLYFYAGQEVMYAIRKRAKEEQIQQLAYTDIQTGLPNRASLDEHLNELAIGDHFAMVFVDADGLKEINDSMGHENGDLLIRTVADAIRTCLRDDRGFCGRWGGDEFVICLRSRTEALQFVEEMNATIQEAARTLSFPISASSGVAGSREPEAAGMTPAEVLRLADQRMYAYKQEHHRAR